MTRSTRRNLLLGGASALSFTAILALPGCGSTGSQTGTVDLTTAQTWAGQISDAISLFAGTALSVVPAALKPTVTDIVKALTAANDAFQSFKPGADGVAGVATQVISAVSKLLAVLGPFVPDLAAATPVGMGIQLGLAVLTAFVNLIPMVVPPVPAAVSRAAAVYQGGRH